MKTERFKGFLEGLVCGLVFCVGVFALCKGLAALAYDFGTSVIP